MRTQKALINMTTGMVYQIVAIICGLITPRLILLNFGSNYNGVISSVTQFLNMINILTLGITGTTRVALYKTLAVRDTLGTSRIMKATKLYMRKVALWIIAYAAILCVVYPFISTSDLSRGQSALLIAIVGIGTFAQYFFGISNTTLLNADQASYVCNVVNVLKLICNTLCVAVLVYLGASVYIVKLGSSIVFFISPLLLELYVKKKYALVSECEPDNAALKGRKAVAYHQVANIIHDNTDILVLTLFTNAKQISVYTVYYLVIGKVKTLLQVFTGGMEAAFGNMWVKREYKTLNTAFRAYEYMLFAFTAVVFSCVGTLILPFVVQYTKGVTDIGYYRMDLAVLISIAEGLFCIRQPYLLLVYATGNYEATKKGAMVEAIINLTLSVVLVPFVGIAGVIVGTLVANAFRTTQYSIFVSRYILNRNILEIVCRFLWVIVCVGMIVPTALWLETHVAIDGWLGWFEQAALVFVLACAVTLLMSALFYRKDMLYLAEKAISLKKHRK